MQVPLTVNDTAQIFPFFCYSLHKSIKIAIFALQFNNIVSSQTGAKMRNSLFLNNFQLKNMFPTFHIKPAILPLTDAQIYLLSAGNKGFRIERNKDGQLNIMSPTHSKTGFFNSELNFQLTFWAKKTKLGYCFDSNTGFRLPDGSLLSPDVSFVRKEKWLLLSEKEKNGFAPICPNFVIELKSDTDVLKELQAKMQDWLENGCEMAWLIDINKEKVHIYRQNQRIKILSFTEKIKDDSILPKFEVDFSFVEEI